MLDTMVETFKGRERDLIVSLCDKYDLDQRAYLHRLTRALAGERQEEVSYVSASSTNDDSRLSVHEGEIHVSNVYLPAGAQRLRAEGQEVADKMASGLVENVKKPTLDVDVPNDRNSATASRKSTPQRFPLAMSPVIRAIWQLEKGEGRELRGLLVKRDCRGNPGYRR